MKVEIAPPDCRGILGRHVSLNRVNKYVLIQVRGEDQIDEKCNDNI